MLTERVRASYHPFEIQDHLDYARQSWSGAYPTRYLLRRFYTEVEKVYHAEVSDGGFFLDELRDTYRNVLLGHAAIVNSISIEGSDDVALAAGQHIHSIEGADVGTRGMWASIAPFENATGYALEALEGGQLETWCQDVVGYAMRYVNAVHGIDCIDLYLDDPADIYDAACQHCPRRAIAEGLLLPLRESGAGALGDPASRRTKQATDALLRTAILHGFTSFDRQEEFVGWLYDETPHSTGS